MKKILTLLLAFFISMALSAQVVSLEDLDTARYFDFWEGTWEGTWTEGEGIGTATNQLTWIVGGSVLQENFEIISGQSKGFKGTSISVFQPGQKKWKQAWADNQGGYFDFTGSIDGEKRIFQTGERQLNGKKIMQRMVFKEVTQSSFTWDWELSEDGGQTWKQNWQINYVRVAK